MTAVSEPDPENVASRPALAALDHLRYARVWLWLGILMIAVVVILSVVDPPRAFKSVFTKDKVIHCFVYACLMGWFTQIFRQHLARLVLAAVFIAMGIAVEYVQGIVPARQFEVWDMVANTSGVVLAWALSYTRVGDILVWFERTCLRKPDFSS